MGVSENRGTPKSFFFDRDFHYKPSILGYPYFWKHPYTSTSIFNDFYITHGSPPLPALLSGWKELYYFLDPQKAATAEPAIHRAIEANSFSAATHQPINQQGFLYMSLVPFEASLW